MGAFETVWIAFGGLIALMWLARLALMEPMLRRRSPLTPQSTVELPASPPTVSVLVAANNEEDAIATCMTTLLAQDYPALEVIAINDRSTDRTGEILAEFASRGDDRFSFVTIESLPPNWFGKPHAMHEGIKHATGDWLVFSDADCIFDDPRTISIAVSRAIERRADLLTIIPALDAPTWWERILQPVCAIVLMFWFQPDKVNDPRSTTAYANGAFILMTRRTLEVIGGFEAVRREISEDTKLARLTKRVGFSLRVEENVGLYRTRMYETVRQAFRGWSRIFGGALARPSKVLLAALLLVTFSIGPWVGFLSSVLLCDSTTGAGAWAVGLWGAGVLLMQLTMLRLYRAVGFGGRWSLAYTVGACGMLGILISALLKSMGATTTTWRSTVYRAGGQEAQESPMPVAVSTPPSERSTS